MSGFVSPRRVCSHSLPQPFLLCDDDADPSRPLPPHGSRRFGAAGGHLCRLPAARYISRSLVGSRNRSFSTWWARRHRDPPRRRWHRTGRTCRIDGRRPSGTAELIQRAIDELEANAVASSTRRSFDSRIKFWLKVAAANGVEPWPLGAGGVPQTGRLPVVAALCRRGCLA